MIFQATYPRTLTDLLDRIDTGRVEAWTFDDRATRMRAEQAFAVKGVTARIRSAYKPLVHFFLEEVGPGLIKAEIAYPRHPSAVPNRFLLETYPLSALLPGVEVTFTPGAGPDYDVTLTFPDRTETHRVRAPNRVHVDAVGETLLSPTGWLVHDGTDEALETEFEALFHDTIAAIAAQDWGEEPYFDELNIAVTLPVADDPLPHADEVVSLREALHEDLYFTLLEVFQRRSGRPLGDRGLQPGQIVPEVRFGPESAVRVEVRPLSREDRTGEAQDLDTATAPLPVTQIADILTSLNGTAFQADTRSGRQVTAMRVTGTGAPIMISAGQHANETTGIVGALRAGRRLAEQGAAFTLSPLENPDGYALHQRLIADNPRHMHHAARYTALGDDLEYRAGAYEKAIRLQAEALTGAALHVNLHGYPAHEWTRPLSGYVPRNFAMWTIPKGFFLVLRHHADHAQAAERLIDGVTRRLADVPGLIEDNNAQIALYEVHAGETGYRMINGFPCLVHADDRHSVPLTLITEYPDETIYGAAFRAGHEAQMQTVLAAHAVWQEMSGGV
ncbi:peptidase M14 [Falsirhodobacter halotolerans]|uniref:peptidase M14 n=1 Tax=Falsirhodobacter halotolerans TaxID=1146892 RepID=UPI001FD37357|nr:peptidase M14 [Falsirhodobacter halotolerans]MCJ8140027.1 peptidase M14 [Falsirhodobacter halotolerans]